MKGVLLACGVMILFVAKAEEKKMLAEFRKIGDSIVDSAALTFSGGYYSNCINGNIAQQDALVSLKGHQYAIYYNAKRHVCLGRRKLAGGNWEVIEFEDYGFAGEDTHNYAVMGICPGDGTIHLAFDDHCTPLHYRVSRKEAALKPEACAWTAQLFNAVTSELIPGKSIGDVTYPRFFSTPKGALQLYYRFGAAGQGDHAIVEYDPQAGSWRRLGVLFSGKGTYKGSNSRCAYSNGLGYDEKGRLHVTWCWREPGADRNNHDLQYSYSDDFGRTWLNNKGAEIAKLPESSLHVASPDVIAFPIPLGWGMENKFTQVVDRQARVHTVLWENPPDAAQPSSDLNTWQYYHYWRDSNGKWTRNALGFGQGKRPSLFVDRQDNLYLVYNKSRDYKSGGQLEIARATAKGLWSDWAVCHKEAGPFMGEPVVDRSRMYTDGILSVYVQQEPGKLGGSSPLRVLDFQPQPASE